MSKFGPWTNTERSIEGHRSFRGRGAAAGMENGSRIEKDSGERRDNSGGPHSRSLVDHCPPFAGLLTTNSAFSPGGKLKGATLLPSFALLNQVGDWEIEWRTYVGYTRAKLSHFWSGAKKARDSRMSGRRLKILSLLCSSDVP